MERWVPDRGGGAVLSSGGKGVVDGREGAEPVAVAIRTAREAREIGRWLAESTSCGKCRMWRELQGKCDRRRSSASTSHIFMFAHSKGKQKQKVRVLLDIERLTRA